MKTLRPVLFLLICLNLLVGCSKSPEPSASASPDAASTPNAANRELQGNAHLKLAAFKVVMKHQGENMIIKGDAQGKLSIANGDEVEALQVYADGHLSGDVMGDATCVLGPDGVLSLDNKPSPLRVTDEGDIEVNGQIFFRREGDTYVQVQSRPGAAKIEFDVEGPAEADRLIGYLVALSTYMLEGEAIETSPE